MKARKVLVILVIGMMVLAFAACSNNAPANDTATPAPAPAETAPAVTGGGDVLIGSCVYKFDDTFMTGVRNAMTDTANQLGAQLEIADSQNKQPTQNEQVDTFITKGVDSLAINPVDRTAAGPIADKAKAAGLPIVFFNREPLEDVMQSYDKIWYVGARAEESGTMSGAILVDYFNANPDADKNGDGLIQYVLMQGEPGHQDAELRTEYSQKAMFDAGWILAKENYKDTDECLLAIDTAMWDKVKGADLMKAWIASIGLDKIEAVVANNDDMGLGAIEALKAEGYNTGDPAKFIPVVSVDATAPALEAMKDGSLLGTVLNDAVNQGAATVKIAFVAANGQAIDSASIGYEVTDGKYVWIPYVKVTKDNFTEFM